MRVRAAMLAGLGGVATVVGVQHRRARRTAGFWQPPAGEHRRAGSLAVRTLGDTGAPILLLHGLVASGVYWGAEFDRLAQDHRLIVPDLLGFGGSDRPESGYGPDDHVEAVIECLDALGIRGPVTIGAHSLGCLVGLRMAVTHPERVTGLVGFGPPLYADRSDARARIRASGPMARLFALPGPGAELSCRWVCAHHRLAARVAVLTHPRLPSPIAADSVEHNWASYSQTLTKVILDAGAAGWLETIDPPIHFVAGDRDRVVHHQFLLQLGLMAGVTVEIWPGRHDLPLEEGERCAAAVAAFAQGRVATATEVAHP